MLHYHQLKARPHELLAATGLTAAEFEQLLAAFETAYATQYPPERTLEGKGRQRQAGAGAKGQLKSLADKLLFVLVYHKTNPLQTLHGLQFGLSQAQANYWIHHLLPVLQQALRDLGAVPERTASQVAVSALAHEGGTNLGIDGTERPRQRPQAKTQQKAHYSGKKKTHTDKNILLVNEQSRKVVYLSATVAGKTHDKKAADEAEIAYPRGATLTKDTGFQGYEPHGVLTAQPKKSPRGKP
jgi:Helix-turn-helix of DDE superfamily endonuclease/DDE superfamily endonuclease